MKRSGGGRKRVRRSTELWTNGKLDADQLKRSAAVECLMSAADQVIKRLFFCENHLQQTTCYHDLYISYFGCILFISAMWD